MEEEFNLKDEIRRLKEKIDQEEPKKEKKKRFKLPGKAKLSRKNLKDGYVTICYIKNNRDVEFFKVPIDESTTMIKGVPRLATTDDMLFFKKNPLLIVPEWSIKPFSPTDHYDDTVKERLRSAGYALLMNRMQKETLSLKKKMSGWIIILIIAVIGVIGFFLLGGNKFIQGAFGG